MLWVRFRLDTHFHLNCCWQLPLFCSSRSGTLVVPPATWAHLRFAASFARFWVGHNFLINMCRAWFWWRNTVENRGLVVVVHGHNPCWKRTISMRLASRLTVRVRWVIESEYILVAIVIKIKWITLCIDLNVCLLHDPLEPDELPS